MRAKLCTDRSLLIAVGCLAAVATGCATSRGTLDVRAIAGPNPAQGVEVKLVEVADRRVFEVAPAVPSTPSLKDKQIENRSITSRAIARKRNTYGKALGDILLPEGRTVEQLGREALTRGLRESGYRVLEAGDPGFEGAAPLQAEIEKFWMWFTPGFWAVHLEFETLIRVSGPIGPFAGGEEFRGYEARIRGRDRAGLPEHDRQGARDARPGHEDEAASAKSGPRNDERSSSGREVMPSRWQASPLSTPRTACENPKVKV